MNKQEENIADIITLDAIKDITDIFLQHTANTEDVVGLIANKELIEYVMNEALSEDWIYLLKINLEADDDMEYMISIEPDGCLVVQPIEAYDDKYFINIKYAFISMDEDVSQITIDNLLNRDIPIVLFGYDDENDYEDNYTVNGISVDKERFNAYVAKFAPDLINNEEKTSDDDGYSFSVKCNLDTNEALRIIADMERRMMHMNDIFREMDNFRRLFNW